MKKCLLLALCVAMAMELVAQRTESVELVIQLKPLSVETGRAIGDNTPRFASELSSHFDRRFVRSVRSYAQDDHVDSIAARRSHVYVRKPDVNDVVIVEVDTSLPLEHVLKVLSEHDRIEHITVNEVFSPATVPPNDDHYASGQQWHLRPYTYPNTPFRTDIHATEAWALSTGSSTTVIAILDSPVNYGHLDLAAKITSPFQPLSSLNQWRAHGTRVAGVATAITNNVEGVAGVDHNARIYSRSMVGSGPENNILGDAIYNAVNIGGADILNLSISSPAKNAHTRRALTYAYNSNRVIVASMGNANSSTEEFPAAYGPDIIAVGAINKNGTRFIEYDGIDQKWYGSNMGPHLSVVAPGEVIITTNVSVGLETGDYIGFNMTSAAAPQVSGLAGLLLSARPDLYNDDIKQLIQIGANKISPTGQSGGFEAYVNGHSLTHGHGLIHAHNSLSRLQAPYVLQHHTIVGGTIVGSDSWKNNVHVTGFAGLADGVYDLRRHTVQRFVTFPWMSEAHVWGRGVATSGYSPSTGTFDVYTLGHWVPMAHHFGGRHAEALYVSNNSAILRTYIYEVRVGGFIPLGHYPTTASNVTFAYTIHGIPAPQPFSMQIFGDTHFGAGNLGQWWGVTSGGTMPHATQWYRSTAGVTGPWQHVGSNGSYAEVVNEDFWLRVDASDSSIPLQSASQTLAIQAYTCGTPPCPMPKTIPESVPKEYLLNPAYPNPFNPTTTLSFGLPERSMVRIRIFDMLGRLAMEMPATVLSAGTHSYEIDGRGLASGLYLIIVDATNSTGTFWRGHQPVTLIK